VIANNEATIPALLAVVNDQRIGQIRLIEGLISWDSAFQLPYTRGILSNIAPGILEIADIPDLMAAVSPRKVILQSPVMATGEKAAAEEMEKILAPVREKEKTSGVKVLDILP